MKYIIFTQNFVQNKIKINLKLIYVSLLTLLVMSKKDFKTTLFLTGKCIFIQQFYHQTETNNKQERKA